MMSLRLKRKRCHFRWIRREFPCLDRKRCHFLWARFGLLGNIIIFDRSMISVDFDEIVWKPSNCPKSPNVDFRHVPTVPNRTKRHDAFLTMMGMLGDLLQSYKKMSLCYFLDRFVFLVRSSKNIWTLGAVSWFRYVWNDNIATVYDGALISQCLEQKLCHVTLFRDVFVIFGMEVLSFRITSCGLLLESTDFFR
jgi:hypothetical protein